MNLGERKPKLKKKTHRNSNCLLVLREKEEKRSERSLSEHELERIPLMIS